MRGWRCLFPGMAAAAAVLGFLLPAKWAESAEVPAQEPLPLMSPVTARAQCPTPGLPPQAARACAEAAARLEALRVAAAALPQRREIRMGLTDAAQRLAMTAQLYTPLVSHAAAQATVTLLARPHAAQTVSQALRNPELLALRLALLQECEALLGAVRGMDTLEEQKPLGARGTWYRAKASPPDAPPPSIPMPDRALEPAPRTRTPGEALARKFAALSQAQDALHLSPQGWLVRPEALARLEEGAEILPQSPVLRLLLAEAQLQRDLPQQSIASCGEALRLAPGLERARYIRALAHWRLQQLALAEDDLSASLADLHDQVPQSLERASRLRARGALRMLRRDYPGMCADFTAACALGDCEGLGMARAQNHCLGDPANQGGADDSPKPRRPGEGSP